MESSEFGIELAFGKWPPVKGSLAFSRPAFLQPRLDLFTQHIYYAHLQRSPQQQVGDIENTNQYVTTHTVLVEMMIAPTLDMLDTILNGSPPPFIQHVYHAHLERSPMGQVSDILNFDQYVKTHTVLVEMVADPALTALFGGC